MLYFKKKSKRGSILFLSLMLGIILFILALAFAPGLSDVITGDDVMGSNGLDCDNESISNQDKAGCTSIDSMQFLWFFVVAGLAVMVIGRVIL